MSGPEEQVTECAECGYRGGHHMTCSKRGIVQGAFRPGVYRHYKGDLYYAMFLTEDSNNGPDGKESTQELEVVYIALDGPKAGQRCNRKLKQWNEIAVVADGDGNPHELPRFQWVRP